MRPSMAVPAIPTATVLPTATYAPQTTVQRVPSYVPPPAQMAVTQRPSYVPPVQVVANRPSYVAPPVPPMQVVANRPSYVAPPVQMAPTMPAVIGTMGLPTALPIPQAPGAPPPKLTAGIPDPAQIEKQKIAYALALDKQLQDAILTVQNETRIEKEMVAFKTQKDIAIFEAQADEKLVEQMAMEDERAAFATCQLKKASVDRKIMLNNQAENLVMDYNMQMTMRDLASKKAAFEKSYVTQELKLAQDYNQAAMKGGIATPMPGMPVAAPMYTSQGCQWPYAAPPTVVV